MVVKLLRKYIVGYQFVESTRLRGDRFCHSFTRHIDVKYIMRFNYF